MARGACFREAGSGPDERGFILVGVVMFMIALTILGLSLFALSSYEAQFFTASAAREQSLQNAESGMELAKALLTQSPPPQRLEEVRRAIGQFGVTNAYAYQARSGVPTDTTSQGPVNWNSPLVLVVSARSRNSERTLEARYNPVPAEDPYQRLATGGTGIRVSTSSPSVLELRGGVWQPVTSALDTAWTRDVTWTSGRPVKGDAPPRPRADAFVDAMLADPATADPQKDFTDDQNLWIRFENPGPAPVRFFRNPPSTTTDNGYSDLTEYSFFAHKNLDIYVRGTVVWVVPEGGSFKERVVVHSLGGGPNTLVIVAKRNGRDDGLEDRGLSFKGGLRQADDQSRVYLVSEGDIGLTHLNEQDSSHEALRLCVVAGGWVEFGGPDPGDRFLVGYDKADMDPLAERLFADGALPALTASTRIAFEQVRPSWVETTPR